MPSDAALWAQVKAAKAGIARRSTDNNGLPVINWANLPSGMTTVSICGGVHMIAVNGGIALHHPSEFGIRMIAGMPVWA